jgi:hypothetical protein
MRNWDRVVAVTKGIDQYTTDAWRDRREGSKLEILVNRATGCRHSPTETAAVRPRKA